MTERNSKKDKPNITPPPVCFDWGEQGAFSRRYSQGAELTGCGVSYRIWTRSPDPKIVIVDGDESVIRRLPLQPEGDGYFSALDANGDGGDLYLYQLDGESYPDPFSRFQPLGVHGPSQVYDSQRYRWSDNGWVRPPFSSLIIYEIHVGTFTPEGTFSAAINKLPYLATLGITALELMPIADFPGNRNWGYDGVSPFAPAHAYGSPNDLRALIEAAHGLGLAMILDVVYNHLGPDGNYLASYHSEYLNSRHQTPWGDGLNYSRHPVRALFIENASYWMDEYHFDGFRFDATHAINDNDSSRHILSEINGQVHRRGGYAIAEDERNELAVCLPENEGGLAFDGCWADDFHHVVRVMLLGEHEAHYGNFEGTTDELVDTLHNGWLYRGQETKVGGNVRGTECHDLPPEAFVYCISNHDQVGNRAFGDRLGHQIDAATYRAASALLCFSPYTPMIFMGQEWNASSPFQFFTNHADDLGVLITKGRQREFSAFSSFAGADPREIIPDPQAEQTFLNSKLQWEEQRLEGHDKILELYRNALLLRKSHGAFRDRSRSGWRVSKMENNIIAIHYGRTEASELLVLVDLQGSHANPDVERHFPSLTPQGWVSVFSTNESRFGGTGELSFENPITLVMTRAMVTNMSRSANPKG